MRLSSIFFFQLIRTANKKVLFLKKICGMLLFKTLKIKKSDFLNSNTCFYSRLYGIRGYVSTSEQISSHFQQETTVRQRALSPIARITILCAGMKNKLVSNDMINNQLAYSPSIRNGQVESVPAFLSSKNSLLIASIFGFVNEKINKSWFHKYKHARSGLLNLKLLN